MSEITHHWIPINGIELHVAESGSGDGPLGNGAHPSTTDVCAMQYERSLPAVPHAADRDLQSHLRRQILLHSLLPAGRPSGKGVGSRPPALSAQHAVVSFG